MFIGDLKMFFMVGGSSLIASGVHHFLPPPIFITDDYSLVFFSPTSHISVLRIHSCWQSSSSLLNLHEIPLNIILSCHVVSHFHHVLYISFRVMARFAHLKSCYERLGHFRI